MRRCSDLGNSGVFAAAPLEMCDIVGVRRELKISVVVTKEECGIVFFTSVCSHHLDTFFKELRKRPMKHFINRDWLKENSSKPSAAHVWTTFASGLNQVARLWAQKDNETKFQPFQGL